MAKEVKNYIYLCKKIKNEDYQKRVENSFEYYIKRANFYKYIGMTLSIMGIILPAVATILITCEVDKIWIACFTSTATILSGIFAYLKCSDKQETYRKAAENMKAELAAYVAEQGHYKENGEETLDKEAILFEQIEGIIQNGYERIVELNKQSEKTEN